MIPEESVADYTIHGGVNRYERNVAHDGKTIQI
jgi:hypothetical protein